MGIPWMFISDPHPDERMREYEVARSSQFYYEMDPNDLYTRRHKYTCVQKINWTEPDRTLVHFLEEKVLPQ